MKHAVLAISFALALPGFTPQGQTRTDAIQGTWQSDAREQWSRRNDERWVSIQLERGDNHHNGFGVPAREVQALADPAGNGPVHLTLRRDAGTFTFDGQLRDGRGSGDFRFAPDQQFAADMARLGYQGLSGEDLWRFAMFDITRDYATGYRRAGYTLDADELVKTAIHGASPAFVQEVKQAGLGQPPVEDLIKMRIHGVTPEFVREMRGLGYSDLSIDTLVKLRVHGVTADFARRMADLGFKNAPLDRLVAFRIHGVSPEFIKSFTDLGYKSLDGDALVNMRIHGVTPEFVKALTDLGYKGVAIDDLVKMRIHGVTPEYIRQMREVGYGKEDVDQLVAFRIHGVDAGFVRDAESHGFKNLSADDLVDLKIHAGRWMRRG
jgi:hypothetical protein